MKIISIYNLKGGVGKSTIAVCLTGYIADKKKKKVTLLDLDFRRSSKIFFSNTEKEFPNIDVHISGRIHEMQRIVENSNSNFIIIDCGGFDNDVNRAALVIADVILVPMSSSGIEILTIQDSIAKIKEIDKINKTCVVLNRIHSSASKQETELRELIENNFGINYIATIHNRNIYQRVYLDFILPHQTKKISEIIQAKKATKEIESLFKTINQI